MTTELNTFHIVRAEIQQKRLPHADGSAFYITRLYAYSAAGRVVSVSLYSERPVNVVTLPDEVVR